MRILPDSTWVMAGDSITACERDVSDPLDLGTGYVALVAGMLTACHPSHRIRVLNRGVPGDTVRDLEVRWRSDVLSLDPDWLSVCIGINDVWQQFDGRPRPQPHVALPEYERTYDDLLTTARPGLKGLVLMTPYFLEPPGGPMRAMMDIYAAAVKRMAHKHSAIVVDAQAEFDRLVQHVPVDTLAWDGAHLTLPGHLVLARAVLRRLDLAWDG